MKNNLRWITLILASVFLTACEDEPKSPLEVSQAFWYAVENKKHPSHREIGFRKIPAR